MSLFNPVFAVNWVDVPNLKKQDVQIDSDSIRHINNYLFFNIKILNSMKTQYRVLTIQSAFKHPYCARISNVSYDEYVSLNGNYDNIANNSTDKLEMAIYGSVAHSAYVVAMNILNENKPKIIENATGGIVIE